MIVNRLIAGLLLKIMTVALYGSEAEEIRRQLPSLKGKDRLDALFVYTDGLNEAENRQQEQFTDERLLQILEATPFESARQKVELLKAEVEKHRDGAEPNDDLMMLCVEVKRTITEN